MTATLQILRNQMRALGQERESPQDDHEVMVRYRRAQRMGGIVKSALGILSTLKLISQGATEPPNTLTTLQARELCGMWREWLDGNVSTMKIVDALEEGGYEVRNSTELRSAIAEVKGWLAYGGIADAICKCAPDDWATDLHSAIDALQVHHSP